MPLKVFAESVITLSAPKRCLSASISTASSKSLLLTMITQGLPSAASRMASSSAVRPALPSITQITSSESCSRRRLFSTPIFSTKSSVERMPAVSASTSGTPSNSSCSSITSRVVPAYCETIARSSRSSALSRLLLPTFGLPTIAVRKPSRRILPVCACARRPSILLTATPIFSCTAP